MTKILGDLRADKVGADQTVDTGTLAASISTCFRMARDGRYTESQRGAFYANGVVLREQLKVLLGVVFDAGTPELVAANATIKTVNAALAKALADINQAAATIDQLGKLVAQLTRLVELAGVLGV
ncbi:MAG: hypothetical protein KKA16_01355 [Alphaproteobacteria bacterium]|nr:hypothetical protein [Alphaproteobacteria bacterium]MBU2379526.1 hypothetical protein [Alphaproteobacteria bacterium]